MAVEKLIKFMLIFMLVLLPVFNGSQSFREALCVVVVEVDVLLAVEAAVGELLAAVEHGAPELGQRLLADLLLDHSVQPQVDEDVPPEGVAEADVVGHCPSP